MEQLKKTSFKSIFLHVIVFIVFSYIGWLYIGLNHMKVMGGASDRFIEIYINSDGEEITQYNLPYIKEVALWVVLLPMICTLFIALLRRVIKK